ncbi:MAG TPA: TerC family protein [Candidatus Binatia bacterium]|nr:TerC family protein [Candidatus Binatia bacterium]
MADSLTSVAFWILLLQIGYLNLLLSGDNALVIALAVRALPRHKRVLGQLWGAAGAVVLRLLFLGIVMYLLEVPFLKLVGGLLLIWIAFKLVQSESGAESEVKHGASLWDAVWIIIVADVTMSLDNVLAVAAAARGNFVLIVLGIALSLPIVVWGAGWLARLMNRYAWIVWLGGGILGKVAGQMILEDHLLRDQPWAHGFDHAIPGVGEISLHPLPLGLAAIITILGWRLSRRPHPQVPENV